MAPDVEESLAHAAAALTSSSSTWSDDAGPVQLIAPPDFTSSVFDDTPCDQQHNDDKFSGESMHAIEILNFMLIAFHRNLKFRTMYC
jgi:hypothetical protein